MEDDVLDDGSATDRTTPQTQDQIHLKDFILLFESLPEIWDASDQHSMNKVKKAQAYQKLLAVYKKIKPHATIADVRKKINSLRSNYRKELRKALNSQRSAAQDDQVYKPRSWVFYMLNFLRKIDQRACQNRLSGSEDLQDAEEEANTLPPSSAFCSSLNIVPPPAKKERKISATEQIELFEEADLSLPSQPEQPNVQRTNQNLNLTALYWTQKLEQIDPLQRIYAEKAINDILFEAEMGTLKRNSVQINGPPWSGQLASSSFTLSPSSNAMNSATSSPKYMTS